MGKFVFTNLIGEFEFDGINEKSEQNLKKALEFFRDKKFFSEFRDRNIEITKKSLRESANSDVLIIQASVNIEELGRIINVLIKRLREWYGLYNPEFTRWINDDEAFVMLILKKQKKELLKEIGVNEKNSIGAFLDEKDAKEILLLAKELSNLFLLKRNYEEYIESLMEKRCRNLKEVAGAITGAKLLQASGSLKKLSEMPASKIQVLGAEKAMFRHLKTKAKPPKFGVISQHPFFSKIPKKDFGKLARTIADKVSIAVKVDYFNGKFIGNRLKKEIMEKFKISKSN